MNCLDLQPSCPREFRGAIVIGGENVGYRVHSPEISDYQIIGKPSIYPFLGSAFISQARHYTKMPKQDLVERIQAAAAAQKVTQKVLAEVAGLPSQSAMSNVFKRIRKLQLEEADRLSRFLGIEPEPEVSWIPVIGLASAGSWNDAVQMPVREYPIPRRLAGPRAFGVVIKGDSMDLLLPEGGWAVIDPDQTDLYAGKVYLIQNGEHEVTVKRFAGDPARFEPVSRNPEHQPLFLAGLPYQVIGRVVSYGNIEGL